MSYDTVFGREKLSLTATRITVPVGLCWQCDRAANANSRNLSPGRNGVK